MVRSAGRKKEQPHYGRLPWSLICRLPLSGEGNTDDKEGKSGWQPLSLHCPAGVGPSSGIVQEAVCLSDRHRSKAEQIEFCLLFGFSRTVAPILFPLSDDIFQAGSICLCIQ